MSVQPPERRAVLKRSGDARTAATCTLCRAGTISAASTTTGARGARVVSREDLRKETL